MEKTKDERCKLCHRIAKLKYSHILPEFLYLPMYDELHRLEVRSDPAEKGQFIQKGVREYLLCEKCEMQFSRYEHYAAPIIKSVPSISPDPSGRFLFVPGVDYSQFKLFQMSLLWRASISKAPIFAAVSLGKYEENVRSMLLAKKPGQSHEYGCVMFAIQKAEFLDKIMWSPVRDTIDGHTCYRFITGDIFWYFFLSSHSSGHPAWDHLSITESGTLRIIVAPWLEKKIVERLLG